jgi:hypothetical protein
MLSFITEKVKECRYFCEHVEFSALDATRAEKAFLCEAITAGMMNSDPAKCNLWRSMGSGAELPEPEDAVLFLSALTAIRTLGLLAQSGPSTTEQ